MCALRLVVAAACLLSAAAYGVTPRSYEVTKHSSRRIFRIVASQCRTSTQSRIFTGFHLDKVGIVTAAHGVLGCRAFSAKPAAGDAPQHAAAELALIALDKDLAVLAWKDKPLPEATGLERYNAQSQKNSGNFMVCGYPNWLSATYSCRPVQVISDSTQQLATILRAGPDEESEPRYKSFLDRKSPDPAIDVFYVSPSELIGHGDSGAPIIDRGSGTVIGVVNGGGAINGKNVAWAIPLEGISWLSPQDQLVRSKIDKLARAAPPVQLSTSEMGARVAARPMTPSEQGKFEQTIRHFAQGLLETYPCQWMLVGEDLMNAFCGQAPCTKDEIVTHYQRRIQDFKEEEVKLVCNSIVKRVQGFSTADPVSLTCTLNEAESWLSKYATWPFGKMLNPSRMGAGSQPDLLRNILWFQVPDEKKNEVLRNILVEWEKPTVAGNANLLKAAAQAFAEVESSCAPSGCELGFMGLTTKDGWPTIQRTLFDEWLSYFADANPPFVRAGCENARLTKDAASRWRFEQGATCAGQAECFEFGAPAGTANAARAFAATIPKARAQLELQISANKHTASAGDSIKYSVSYKNSGGVASSSLEILVSIPPCLTVESQTNSVNHDEAARELSELVAALPPGRTGSFTFDAKVEQCSADQRKLTVSAALSTADGVDSLTQSVETAVRSQQGEQPSSGGPTP